MITILRAVSSDRIAAMANLLAVIRVGRFPGPSCDAAMDPDRCVRRVLRGAGGYWPKASPTNVNSSSDATAAVRALQRDLGVTVDGDWKWETQEALERAMGGSIPETVPTVPWPRRTRPGTKPPAGGGGAKPPPSGVGAKPPAEAGSGALVWALGLGGRVAAGAGAYYWLRKRRRR